MNVGSKSFAEAYPQVLGCAGAGAPRFLSLSSPRYLEGTSGPFREAVDKLSSLKDADNQTKLKLYALYKQATVGKNSTKKPGMLDIVGKAKWEAWNSLGEMSKVWAKLYKMLIGISY